MQLYHVTQDINEPVTKQFRPRVPVSASDIEDLSTPRICLSTDVEHCIQAISAVDVLEKDKLLRVYTYEMRQAEWEDFIPPYYLWRSGAVFDAMHNMEVWCLKEITMQSALYRILSFDCEMAVNWYAVDCQALRSLIRDRVGIKTGGNTAEDVWNYVSAVLARQKRYDDIDDLREDMVTAFPCQSHIVKKVDLQQMPETCIKNAKRKEHRFYIGEE